MRKVNARGPLAHCAAAVAAAVCAASAPAHACTANFGATGAAGDNSIFSCAPGGGAASSGGLVAAAVQAAPAPSAVGAAAVTNVSIQDFFYGPAAVVVNQGDTVHWVNEGFAPHTVTSGVAFTPGTGSAFRSPIMNNGDTYNVTFNQPGTYPYFCEVHPFMVADLTVNAAPVPEPAAGLIVLAASGALVLSRRRQIA